MTWVSFLFAHNWAGKKVPEFTSFALPQTRKDYMTRVLICCNLTTSIYNLQAKLEWLQGNPRFSRKKDQNCRAALNQLFSQQTCIGACTLASLFLGSLCEFFLCLCLEGVDCAWWPMEMVQNKPSSQGPHGSSGIIWVLSGPICRTAWT